MKPTGAKAEVWAGTAQHTAGKLTRSDIMLNKAGKVVSKWQHANGLKQAGTLITTRATSTDKKRTGPQKGSGIFSKLLGFTPFELSIAGHRFLCR